VFYIPTQYQYMKQESESTPRTQSQYVINSAYRTLQVLLAFSAPPHRFSLAEMAQRIGVDKNQTYRSLKTLEEAGFLRMDEDGRFSLTPILGVLNAASADSQRASLVDVAAPHLDKLAAETGETVNLFVLAGDHAVCVDRRDSSRRVHLASVLGLSVPLHAGAVPKAILANLPEAEMERVLGKLSTYPQYTAKTIMQPTALRRDLAETRTRGYSVGDEDYDSEARGVGAAIFDHSGQVVGGVSVGGPSFRVSAEVLEQFGGLLVPTARAIARQLGYTG
jgi:DNA-binding IclR family transcriptional regulator